MLTDNVKENLKEAEGYLRNALYHSAKNERSMVCTAISDLIMRIEALQSTDALLDKLENRKPGDRGFFGTFWKDE
jgi:hypothetical protein